MVENIQKSGATFILYPQPKDVIAPTPPPLRFDGVQFSGMASTLTSVQMVKQMGVASGQVIVTVKSEDVEAMRGITDYDWFDLSFTWNGRNYAQMRGVVIGVQEQVSVVNGATSRTWNITCHDHGYLFDKTVIYFNRFISQGAILTRTQAANGAFFDSGFTGAPDSVVAAYLFKFLTVLGNQDSGVYLELPKSLTGGSEEVRFADYVKYRADNFTNKPERLAVRPLVLDPEMKGLWALATQWGDPQFCELFTDLLPSNEGTYIPGQSLELNAADPVVIFRDRPFPFGDDPRKSAWFDGKKVTLYEVPSTDVFNIDFQKGGEERYNAFFYRTHAEAGAATQGVDLVEPLLDPTSVEQHGLKRFDAASEYTANIKQTTPRAKIDFQRAQVRDWYMLNPYFFAGTVALGRGLPSARIGNRFRVNAPLDRDSFTGYIEGVSHSWSLMAGLRTTLRLSRVTYGSDDQFFQQYNDVRRGYRVAENLKLTVEGSVTTTGSFIA